jgi:hypothetical protein
MKSYFYNTVKKRRYCKNYWIVYTNELSVQTNSIMFMNPPMLLMKIYLLEKKRLFI